jgi:hypothetical protein
MKKSVLKSIALLASASALSFIATGAARADDPLKYPPFNWNFNDAPVVIGAKADKPAEAKGDTKKGKKATTNNNGPQTDFSQGKDKSKQWYDGDFNGLDDD